MDWSPHRVMLGGQECIVHTGSIVLCFSSWGCMHFYENEKIASVIHLHKKTFHELQSVVETMTYDNMTTVGRHVGPGKVWMNPEFLTHSEEYGFEPIILPPGAKDRHGCVERMLSYIEGNFLKGREFVDFDDSNRRGDIWRARTASVRIHGTHRERPIDRLERERPYLKPLPHFLSKTYHKEVKRIIERDFCVSIDTSRYSTNPSFVGEQAFVRLYDEYLEIWIHDQMHCRHTYTSIKGKRQVLPEHEKEFRETTSQKVLFEDVFLRLGDIAKTFYEGLKEQRGKAAGYHMQRILKLANRHGADVINGAMAHAQRFGAYSAEAINRIIQGKALKKHGKHLPSSEIVPEKVKQWLKTCSVENQSPEDYDSLVEKWINQTNDFGNDDNDK